MGNQIPARIPTAVHSLEPSEIEKRLRKGTADQILDALSALMAAYPNVRADGGTQRIRGYVLALECFGLATIRRAVTAALRGEIGKPGLLPLAPELAAWCRAEERFDREQLTRIALPRRSERPRELRRSERVERGFEGLADVLAKTAIETSLANARTDRASHRKENHNGNRGSD